VPSPARIRSTIATITDPPEELAQLRTLHKALGDVTRLRILRRLADGDATVTDVTEHVDLSQPLVSWHIKTLRDAGLIETRRAGRAVICSLRREALLGYAERERHALGLVG
jgi:ArsR family transcriptional regulator, arsenate/arsenite/antimonite-responsive transcriptional repressor